MQLWLLLGDQLLCCELSVCGFNFPLWIWRFAGIPSSLQVEVVVGELAGNLRTRKGKEEGKFELAFRKNTLQTLCSVIVSYIAFAY